MSDLPIFRPKFGRPRPEQRGFRAGLAARLGSIRRATRPRSARARAVVRPPREFSRRVAVKARYVPASQKNAALHLKYIERDGVQPDGSPGVLYGPSDPTREALLQPLEREQHQFRFILSPEDGAELDMTSFVREYMRRLEAKQGQQLIWGAVNHHDTDQPHAHIVVRGIDRQGREVRFDRHLISHGMRWLAQELATEELGPRTERDVSRQNAKEVTQDRFTALDAQLQRLVTERGVIPSWSLDALHRQRIDHLERAGLAVRERAPLGALQWRMQENWQRELRRRSERNDVLKRMHRALRADPSHYVVVRRSEPVPASVHEARVVHGRVAAVELVGDGMSGRMAAIIEATSGRGYYVPLSEREAAQVQQGDHVSFQSKPKSWGRAIDKELLAGASADRGRVRAEPGSAHEHRLKQLERDGLATRITSQVWSLPDNAAARFAERQAKVSGEFVELRVEPQRITDQVKHLGPVWLDSVEARGHSALAAELRERKKAREELLDKYRMPREPANRMRALKALERAELGRKLSRQLQARLRSDRLDGFRGSVRVLAPEPNGSRYAVIRSESEFALVRATPSVRQHDGQTVVLSYQAQHRRFVVQRDERARDRER